jgi:hypothetical protein
VKLIFADEAWDDYLYWQKQDKRMVERINLGRFEVPLFSFTARKNHWHHTHAG